MTEKQIRELLTAIFLSDRELRKQISIGKMDYLVRLGIHTAKFQGLINNNGK